MPQLKFEQNRNKIQILCVHAIALSAGKKAKYWFQQLSHLCGIRQCINEEHLVWELPWDNISRDGCHKYGYWKECNHNPKCLLPEPPFEACVEAINKKRQQMETEKQQDIKKMKKRLQNKNNYEKHKKQKLLNSLIE